MKTAVLITVHNRVEKTLSCLRCLKGQPLPEGRELDVFLTDDGSTDGTADAVRASFPEVNILSGDGNLFWCRGMIRAWEAAIEQGGYQDYLWLNDDTDLVDGALLSLFSCADRHPGSIVVGPTCSRSGSGMTYGGRNRKGHVVPDGQDLPLETFDGNIVLVPHTVVEKIGILDNRFSHAMGDSEYGARAVDRGVQIWQMPEYAGYCELHEKKADWCNPEVPLLRRLKALYSPLGCPPNEFFIYDRYHGLLTAAFHFCTIHIRTIFPGLWRNDPS